ncbi:MAG: tripartite tricarboxylate transporter substrate binding protein [Clostridiales bacterium]|nr:tripartite tricarboxylate transporter substrate binding protein [Clostridiales bacterium]
MKKKKVCSVIVAAALVMGLAACGSGSKSTKTAATTAAAAETTADTATTATSASAEAAETSAAAWAPDEPVTIIVAYKAGSGTDTTARILTQYATEQIGQTIVIDNLEGGSGSIGWTALAKADPDGYTLGFVNLPTLCSNIVEELGDYTMDDFVSICNHVNETALVLVAANSPFDTLDDLVAYAKEHPEELKASTNGEKASNHIGAQLFANSADFQYSAIPYGGTADQLLALRQGEVDFSVAKEADIKSMQSELKVLGVFDTKRMESFPDVPTLGELGYYDQWYGSARAIVAPKGTPQEVIDFYSEAFKKAMEDPEYLETAANAGVTTAYMDAEETDGLLQSQYDFCVNTAANLWDE